MCFQQAIPLQNMKDSSKRCTIHFSKLLCLPNDMVSPALEGQKQRSCSVTFVLVTNIIIASLWFHKVWARLSMRSSRPALIILLLLSITCVMFVVLTICGHRHVPFPASTTKSPTWLHRDFTSYDQCIAALLPTSTSKLSGCVTPS